MPRPRTFGEIQTASAIETTMFSGRESTTNSTVLNRTRWKTGSPCSRVVKFFRPMNVRSPKTGQSKKAITKEPRIGRMVKARNPAMLSARKPVADRASCRAACPREAGAGAASSRVTPPGMGIAIAVPPVVGPGLRAGLLLHVLQPGLHRLLTVDGLDAVLLEQLRELVPRLRRPEGLRALVGRLEGLLRARDGVLVPVLLLG